jgi:hypothetical protein
MFGKSQACIDLVSEDSHLSGFCNFFDPYIEKSIIAEPLYHMRLTGKIDSYGVASIKAFAGNKEIGFFTGHLGQSFKGTFRSGKSSSVISFEFGKEYKSEKPVKFNAYCLRKDSSLTDTAIMPFARLELNVLLPPNDSNHLVLRTLLFESLSWKNTNPRMDNETIIKQEAVSYFVTYIENNKDLFDGGASFNWEKTINTAIQLNQKGFLVYRTDNYGYTGGAHGLGITRFLVYDSRKHQKIKLEDIFKEGYERGLSILLDNKYRKTQLVDSLQPLSEAGLYVESIPPTNNFLINGHGIGFYYNPYKIAPYAMGSQFIMLPWSELAHLMKEESSAWRIINR